MLLVDVGRASIILCSLPSSRLHLHVVLVPRRGTAAWSFGPRASLKAWASGFNIEVMISMQTGR